MTLRGRFIPERALALFLDVDGTLLEIAASPDAVRVPAALRNTLELTSQREGGALALVSARSLGDLDRLFAPSRFPACGQNGFERRDACGRVTRARIDHGPIEQVCDLIRGRLARRGNLVLEEKTTVLALHYRRAPQLQREAREIMESAAAMLGPGYQLRTGKCVYELTPTCCSIRAAIESFMSEAPFAGRTPIFVGDDDTDEDGFDAVNALGGYSICVGRRAPSAARFQFATVSGVIAWLRERNTNMRRPPRPVVATA
ncbi:MAG TPA: trehalose-phosphatase [Steroidobacteraceae bacterium]